MKNKILLTLLISLVVIQGTNASQADLDKEINYYADSFSGNDSKKHKKQFFKLLSSGITSPKVFDHVAKKLIAHMKEEKTLTAENASWYAKILGASGNEKYRKLLIEVGANAKPAKLRRHAKQSVSQLDKHIQWNPILAKDLSSAPEGRLEEYRFVNIMSVYDKDFYRAVLRNVKQVFLDKNFKPLIVQALIDRTEYELKRQSNVDSLHIETLSWLVKTIGHSGDVTHKPFLKDVLKRSKVSKVKKHTRQAIRKLSAIEKNS